MRMRTRFESPIYAAAVDVTRATILRFAPLYYLRNFLHGVSVCQIRRPICQA